jgi:hypothetical protein
MALLPGSLAIDAGTSAGAPATDQRGHARVGAVDIGAFESQGFTLTISSGNNEHTTIDSAFANRLSVQVTANNPLEPIDGGQVTFLALGSGPSASLVPNPADISGGQASVTATANGIAGAYTVAATATGAVSGVTFSLTNDKAAPVVQVGDAGGTYNGNAFPATATVAGVDSTPASSLEGVTPTLTYYAGTYTSVSQLSGLTALSGAPSMAGSYTVVASFGGSTDYTSASALANFAIGQATPAVSVMDKGGTYNGNAFGASDSVAGVNGVAGSSLEGISLTLTYYQGTYTLATLPSSGGSSTAPTTAGSYTVLASFAGSTDYTSGSALANFTISKATPTVSVTDASGTYNQLPFAASATMVGVNGIAGASLENVGLTLDYKQLDGSGNVIADLGSTAPFLPGSYSVTASFAGSTDYYPASATTTFTIRTPTTSITGPTIGVPGQPLTDAFVVNGPTQGIVFNINYGDGTSLTTPAGGPNTKLDHLYTAVGSFTIQVTATDKYGVVSQLATQKVSISTVAMEADPSGGTALAVGGNAAGGDTITVSAVDTTGKKVDVTINKTDYGTFTPTGHIFVYGQGGKDTITLKPYVVGNSTYYYIQVPAFLYGEGSGGDKISAAGSAANNELSGHGNNEVLTGGQGRDLLIGGMGAATLNAGTQDDILIGGWTNYDIFSSGMTYDQKLAALDAIMTEWSSTSDSYTARVSFLATYLNTNTVHDNYVNGVAVKDYLYGNSKANDWFFAGSNDSVTGQNKNDVTTTIN